MTASAVEAADDKDEVIGLRAWGTSWLIPLRSLGDSVVVERSPPVVQEATAASTALQHAQNALDVIGHGVDVVCEGPWWRIRDLDGIAQLKQDGRPTREANLRPGTEVKLAGQTLIAESRRSIALRNFCTRLLGWSDHRVADVDQALRAIRLAGSGRGTPLVLRGSGDLVPVAHAIHRRTLGDRAPFVVSDPRRRNMPSTVRSPTNVELGVEAFRRAPHGTLCVRAQRLPADFRDVLRLFREADSTVQLIVCAEAATASRRVVLALDAARIEVPSLETRREEVPRIAHEYLEDAIDELRAPAACLDSEAIQWIIGRSALSTVTISGIEKAAMRAVALRMTGDLTKAAALLGMARVSLERWLMRRQQVDTGRGRSFSKEGG